MRFQYLLFVFILTLVACSTSDEPVAFTNDTTNTPNDPGDNPGGEDPGDVEATYQGDFMNAAHPTSGVAKVNSDNTILRLENFSTDNGPVLELYLATDLTVENYISLGELQGLMGTFDYNLPNNTIDFNVYKYVIVWCVDFAVNFGYAELEAL